MVIVNSCVMICQNEESAIEKQTITLILAVTAEKTASVNHLRTFFEIKEAALEENKRQHAFL